MTTQNQAVTKLRLFGLTGGICAGKSQVAQILQQARFAVINADALGHRILEVGQPAYEPVLQLFGESVLNEDKSINRRKVGALVFQDDSLRLQLNAISHPLIRSLALSEAFRLAPTSVKQIVFLEAALLLESGWYKNCEQIWVVTTSPRVALERLRLRDGFNESEALARLQAQWTNEQRLKLANVTITNEGSLAELTDQVESAVKHIE